MKPSEYIASIKAQKPKRAITQADIPNWIDADLQHIGPTVDEAVRKINERDFVVDYLLPNLGPRLPPELRDLITDGAIAMGEIEDPSPNAHVERIDGEGYAITFNSGLKNFLYRVARVLATRFVISNPNSDDNLAMDVTDTARLIADVFWWYQETQQAFGPAYPIRPEQAKAASLLATEAETFLLAHEIGHIVDDALRHDNLTFLALDDPSLPISHHGEYTADALALKFVMKPDNERGALDPHRAPIIYAGAEFALQVYCTLEKLGFEFPDTHPLASKRLDFIRCQIRAQCDSEDTWSYVSALATAIDTTFSQLSLIITNPQEHDKFYTEQASQLLSALDELLNKCTGGIVPDYMTFYAEAGKLFNVGYSEKMFERVADVAAEFFADVQSSELPKDSKQSWIRFQKFKLLFGFVQQHMCEPASSLFRRAMGID